MKFNVRSRSIVLTIALLVTNVSFIRASWILEWLIQEEEELLEYFWIHGKQIASDIVHSTVEKLSVMAKKHPEAFLKFFLNISDGNTAEVPGEVLQLLKDLEIIEKDATCVSAVVKIIASWSINLDANGNPYVALMQELISAGLNNGTFKSLKRVNSY
jgi:hypothetical protein